MQITMKFIYAAKRAGIEPRLVNRITSLVGDMNCGFRTEVQKVAKLEQVLADLGLSDQIAVVDTGRTYTDDQTIFEVQVKKA